MAQPTYPRVNGRILSYASIEAQVDGEIITGIKSLNYTHKVERAKARGAGRQVLGRTAGEYDCEGSMSMLREDAQALRERFGDGWMDKEFDIVVTFAEEGTPTKVDKLVGCLIDSDDAKNEQGTDPLMTDFALNILRIENNGVLPIRNMRK